MKEFFAVLSNPAVPFIRYALIAGLLSSISFGIIGTYVVVRRISSIAGAIAHSVLAGIGFGLYMQSAHDAQWLTPLLGAIFAAILAALIIALVSMYAKQREDTVIGAIWAIGMAAGLLFIARTPGYVDPMSYLFGNILIISRQDLVLIAVLDGVVVLAGILLYRQFQAVAFDEEFSSVRGLNTGLYYVVLLVLTALTVVLMASIVGIVMVIALLTLPAAVASLFAKNLWQMMLASSLLTMVFSSTGLALSYSADTPSGSMIILVAGGIYLIALLLNNVFRRLRQKKIIHEQNGRTHP
ncbi:MAG: iron chelate uptake ABC transporter family permease subunit [Spirochaetales bacterium]|jgi:zinc transport system permease protein|nr:iron chelate uptake ABC transporter family permease subunit [Spirochaetales bacterium]